MGWYFSWNCSANSIACCKFWFLLFHAPMWFWCLCICFYIFSKRLFAFFCETITTERTIERSDQMEFYSSDFDSYRFYISVVVVAIVVAVGWFFSKQMVIVCHFNASQTRKRRFENKFFDIAANVWPKPGTFMPCLFIRIFNQIRLKVPINDC